MFHVIKAFKDLEDNEYIYQENDIYPRSENKNITKERIEALSTANNKRSEILIKVKNFSEMDIKSLIQYTKIYDIKIPKGSKKEDIIKILEKTLDSENEN